MSMLVADCPRCGAKKTGFDIQADIFVGIQYNWQTLHEAFADCRHCHKGTIFCLSLTDIDARAEFVTKNSIAIFKGSANDYFRVNSHITLRDEGGAQPPEDVPEIIEGIFREGASSLAAGCYNAAGAMFRLALDLTTKQLLPGEDAELQPNAAQRNRLADRLDWLFDTGRLPNDLKDLAACIRQDGNDAAHDGTLSADDATDLLDFSDALLRRTFTEPARLANAARRRDERRNK